MNDSNSLFSEDQYKSVTTRDSASQMTEEEVRDIMQQFNEIININTQELEIVKASLIESRQKQEKAKQEYSKLEQSYNELKQNHSLVVARNSLLQSSHQELKEKLEAKEKGNQNLKESIELEEEMFLAELSSLSESKKSQEVATFLKQKVMQLIKEKEEFRNKIEGLEKDNQSLEIAVQKFKQPQKCKHCYKYFSPFQNTKQSCLFHPGKLKFYSCKGCGGDQYLSCCNYCKGCKEGCREAEHVFS